MRFTQLVVLAASILAVSAAPTLETLEERCCTGVCCDYEACESGVGICIRACANIPNAGGVAGCIAGCYVACG